MFDSRLLLFIAVPLAFIFPQAAREASVLIIPSLIIMMAVSLKAVRIDTFTNIAWRQVWLYVLLTYILQSGLLIGLAYLFVDPLYRPALFILALMPPAVAVISVAYLLKGERASTLIAETVSYLLSLVIVPVGVLVLFGGQVSVIDSAWTMMLVIVFPFFIGQALRLTDRYLPISGRAIQVIVNATLGITFFSIIGMNSERITGDWGVLIPIVLIIILTKFVLGILVAYGLKGRMDDEYVVPAVLFATFKNSGTAVALCIVLFPAYVALPLAIESVIFPFYILFVEWIYRARNAFM